MNEAPERIWASKSTSGNCVVSFSSQSDEYCIEYVRADLVEWQPIETAPKDGRELLLFDGYVYLGSWTNDSNYPDEPKQWFDNSYDDYSCGYASTPLKPTHWLPIQTLPTPLAEEP